MPKTSGTEMDPSPSAQARALAQWLFDYEISAAKSAEEKAEAISRILDKFRHTLSILAGIAGYKSLLSRALTLTIAEAPWFDTHKVDNGGYLTVHAEVPRQAVDKAAKGEVILIAQLLGLLFTFIGINLTKRLVHEQWPDSLFDEISSGTEKGL